MRIARSLVILSLIISTLAARAIAGSADDPKPAAKDDPIYLFLNTPNDLEAFWKLIDRPDRVVLDGEFYRRLLQSAESSRPTELRTAVIQSLIARGRVEGDWAHLTLQIQVVLDREGPEWVPIRLDGLTLSKAAEDGRDLPARTVEVRGWQVELTGKGEHSVEIGLVAPVRSSVEGKRLELAIPPVASTAIDLSVPRNVLDASAGIGEKLAISPSDGPSAGTRLSARLSPRSKLEIAWRERADPSTKLPPLLEANGDVAIDVERDSILTRSNWAISSIRGTIGQLIVRLDPAEEILDVLVDTRPVLVETRVEEGRAVVSIPLAEPLRPGTSRAVSLSTRRPIASEGTVRVLLEGYAFDQAKVQSGMVAISRSGPLFLNPIASRGLRRIDPRTGLPDSLRNRADTVFAFSFNGPPYDLSLNVESAPPRLSVNERTTIAVDARTARIQTRLDCRTSQGRVFEVQVHLPRGLDFEGVEPAESVESFQLVPLEVKGALDVGPNVSRLLSVKLTPQARDGEGFLLVLKGWCAIDASRPVAVPLFQPVLEASRGGRIAVVTDRGVSVELGSNDAEPSAFRLDWGQPPADWEWPGRKPGPEQSVTWLRSDANPETLPLKATVHSRSIRHESTLTARIDRRGADIVEEITGEVAFGTLAKLDLAIPREVGDRWDVEGLERTYREPLEPEPDGTRRYRLRFPREFLDAFRLRLRYRLPWKPSSPTDPQGRLSLVPIRVLEGVSTARRMLISAEPGLEIQAEGKGWSAGGPLDLPVASESVPPDRLSLIRSADDAGPVVVQVRPGALLAVPSVVVSRLWIKTTQRLDDGLTTSAHFWVESRDGSMTVNLGPGSRWVRGRVAATDLGEGAVEQVKPDEYRLRFPPSTPSGPILVSIDYTVTARAASKGWPAPRLVGDGVIQQTVWEAQVLGTRAGIGTPRGWLDENEWYWDGLLWRRRPWKSPLELASWLTAGNSRYRPVDAIEPIDRGNRHGYLFSRVGPPEDLRFPVVSRFTLLLICSGPVLLAGLLVLARRPPPRMMAAAVLLIAFALGALVELDVLILILESSVLGVVLFLIALMIHWVLDRRSPSGAANDLGLIVPGSSIGSTFQRPRGVGSDDSTAIRVVPPPTPSAVSTADHIVLTRDMAHPPEGRSTSELDFR